MSNVVGHASAPEVTAEMKKRVVEYWTNIHKGLGQGLGASPPNSHTLSSYGSHLRQVRAIRLLPRFPGETAPGDAKGA
ncbi:hypothetical protein ABZU75_07595 [Streptosporangium sp. NPDC005286]|uniref:hypothetical protein n=1 Tax=Streptosporangium sp. NPDC005286 TaxID=3154463 RepID=UPI0033A6EF4E